LVGTTFLFIRHAAHVLGPEVIPGASGAACLSEAGHEQARAVAARIDHLPVSALYASPILRTMQTADAIAERLGLPVRSCDALREVGYGDWAGKRIDELRTLDSWMRWNQFRSGCMPPDGELMLEIQARVMRELERQRGEHAGGTVVLVSHGDVIKYTLGMLLGVPIDLCHRLEISPASVSVVQIAAWGPRILSLNNTGRVEVGTG
jgi:broad specificity phosphatase PhoE